MAGSKEYDRALVLLAASRHDEAMQLLSAIVKSDVRPGDEQRIRAKEQATLKLGSLFAKQSQPNELYHLLKHTRPFLSIISKAKAAKVVRNLLDTFLNMEAEENSKVDACVEWIDWAKNQKRTFLRQALEARLVSLKFDIGDCNGALQLVGPLLRELKKLDDKALLVEVQLVESRIYHTLGNISKSRASLTSARTTANAIYCPPKLQATLDMQSGVLHAEEKDFKTAYSYFYESFEGFDSVDHPKAHLALKYMLLSKIMMNSPDDVQSILSGKVALKYVGSNVESMKSIATASHNRSIADFKQTLLRFEGEIARDLIIKAHLDGLYDHLLEQNLCRVIEPFSRVEIDHVAEVIELPLDVVERKLSQMILDKKLRGILDQGDGVLILFDDAEEDHTYASALDTIQSMGKVVDALYQKAKKLS
ncbi:26S proteasome non-ATPase regulatory subunit 11A-like [Oscarella lobularis]|uniref:26S proteasome non-ATPase regulatory subunit 11A-like n=1 Tax=Oscarella lobularis TaxID=121494 RepID=UPI0033141BE6